MFVNQCSRFKSPNLINLSPFEFYPKDLGYEKISVLADKLSESAKANTKNDVCHLLRQLVFEVENSDE